MSDQGNDQDKIGVTNLISILWNISHMMWSCSTSWVSGPVQWAEQSQPGPGWGRSLNLSRQWGHLRRGWVSWLARTVAYLKVFVMGFQFAPPPSVRGFMVVFKWHCFPATFTKPLNWGVTNWNPSTCNTPPLFSPSLSPPGVCRPCRWGLAGCPAQPRSTAGRGRSHRNLADIFSLREEILDWVSHSQTTARNL